ncbi:uncharacterized protein probably involved in trehalose biosynthesis [Perkinsela sp. CCAP 1560/4]|nr:uncharacterized protein probably involved in trehalose biosynthesis [Perkinsela sp. CCAP 1560/4]|eukprot:KNH09482.1 uncharacterized protein probably involved in trehalose biosynthesis [Perkinsela sp. CCAP 1560/4]
MRNSARSLYVITSSTCLQKNGIRYTRASANKRKADLNSAAKPESKDVDPTPAGATFFKQEATRKAQKMKIHVRQTRSSTLHSWQNLFRSFDAEVRRFLHEKTQEIANKQQEFRTQELVQRISQQARMYADVTRHYAQDNVGSQRLMPIGCIVLVLAYYYFQSAKSRALYRSLEETRCSNLDQQNNILRATMQTKEKLEYDISSKENQINHLTTQNAEQMMLIDKLTGSLKLCSFHKQDESPQEKIESS